MYKNPIQFIFSTIFFFCGYLQAQTLQGIIVDHESKEPLYGVSIYFDGTTNGTATDMNGKFSIHYQPSTKSPLVVSYLGYETQLFDVRKLENDVTIYLIQKPQSLETVYIENDPWSRKKKLEIFKREFIGKTIDPKECEILNEDDIKLVYNPATQTLNAYADKPIRIRNKYLGYHVSYNIEEFSAQLQETFSGIVLTKSVYVEGSSFYSELHKKLRRKHRKAREKEYGQSVLYFMRSLANRQLKENGFQVFHKGFIVPPYKYFDIKKEGENTHVKLEAERLVIVYNRFQKSFMTILDENKEFTINKYGNYSPPKRVSFGGVLGNKRIANTLPLDYNM